MSEVSVGWASATVQDLSGAQGLVTDGDWIESKDQAPNGDVRLIQLADIGDGHFRNRSNRFLTSKRATELGCTFLRDGDVLVARMPDPLGRACIFPGVGQKAVTAVDILIWRGASKDVSERWLVHFLNSPDIRQQIASSASGTTRQRISGGRLKALELPVPPAAEQRRIVAKIDSLSSKSKRAREHLDHIPRLVEKYKQAVLTAAFSGALSSARRSANLEPGVDLLQGATHPLPESWTWKAIGEVASVAGGLTKNAKRSQLPSKRPYLRVANVYANELRLDDVATIGCTDKEFEKTKLEPGDLLVVEGNGSIDQIGRVAMWLGAVQDCVHQNHLIRVRCHRNLNPSFALYWLLSPGGRKAIEEKASTTTGLHTLSISKVAQLGIPVPDTMEQAEIVKKIEHAFAWIDHLAAEATSARTLIDKLDQAVLAKAFRGELVPQDPNDEPASVLLERIRAEREAVPAAKPGRGRARRS